MTNREIDVQMGTQISIERKASKEIIKLIILAQKQNLCSELAYKNLADWLIRGHNMSERTAYRKIKAARLSQSVPGVLEKIESGELSVTKVAQVQRAIQIHEKFSGEKVTTENKSQIIQMVEPVPAAQRFAYLLHNLDAVTETLRRGYRLFASSFSYSKIRGEVEAARVDYVAKIHKTLIDIQGQLLGIPVATIIVASQLKSSQGCGVEFWTNIAVLAGAWVFLILGRAFRTNSYASQYRHLRRVLLLCLVSAAALLVSVVGDSVLTGLRLAGRDLLNMVMEVTLKGKTVQCAEYELP